MGRLEKHLSSKNNPVRKTSGSPQISYTMVQVKRSLNSLVFGELIKNFIPMPALFHSLYFYQPVLFAYLFQGSDWSGHSMVLRITSEQTFSLILRPDCIPVFKDLHEVCAVTYTETSY